MVFIRVLGAFATEVNGESVHLGGPRQRGVLALLVAARGQVVPVDRMIEDLWRGEPPARALMSLQAYVSNLRRLLEPGRPPRTPARLLVSAAPGYALRLPPESVDAWRFEELLDRARTDTDPRTAKARLAEALGLWRGPAFAEVADEPWAAAETARLNELRLTAIELHVAAGLRIGDPAAMVPEAERLTRDEPLREEGWRLHALALWSSGRQADALATLRRARGVLAEELGLDPGPDLTALEEAILTQRTDVLRAIVPRTPPAPAPPLTATPPRTAPPSEPAPFVGREAQLSALVTAAAQAVTDGARVALVTGEAGLGKSTLLEHLGRRLERDGWLVAAGRCLEVDSAPPAWAWTEALRAVAATTSPGGFADDLAPLLADAGPVIADATAGRFRLRRALWEWLAEVAAERPVAVVLDDLHWADAATLELLGGGLGLRAPILVVAAYRADESGHLTEMLASLARAAPLRLALPGLSDEAVAELVRTECEADEETIAGIAERTGGNPFYVRESARLLNGEGALVALSEVPEGVRDVLRRRLARLPEGAVSILRLAAVAGRESPVDVLVKAADTDEDGVLDALDAGVISGLLDEPGQGLVRFVHALVRDTLVADLSRLRAARMHVRIADAMEGTDDIAALAHHYARAGSPKAVGYCVQAAELAEARYAHDVAACLLSDAVANSTGPDEHVELLGRLLRAQVRAGAIAAARETRREAVEYAESLGRDDLMIAAFTAWTEPTPWQARTYGTVDRPIVERLSRLLERELTPSVRSRLLTAYANELIGEDDPTVLEAAQEALDLATGPRLRAAALEILAEVHGDAELSQELVKIGTEHDLPVYRVTGRLNHAAVAAAANDPVTMRRVTVEALELARTYRMPEATAVAEITLAALAVIEGRFDDAARLYNKAGEGMRRAGSVHAAGFLQLALAVIWLNDGTLGAHLDDVRAVHAVLDPMTTDLLALALHANGLDTEAREVRASSGPIRPDFFFTFLTTLRAMAIVALDDRDAAEEIYATLLPHRDGPPAGAESMAVALRPVAHTLGELAVLLGRDHEAADHFAQAAAIADQWNAPHWAAEARSRATT
ncbi:AfsR/SARP family transcriptional regulator [Actinomadura violacea]|uniref:AAA family ATPase n=1 Tax=Actinomadura violacea TaxID=2819934 RepID=A0ABS3RMU5_9ACTN|nr:AfsR/SARP family transcriptional regulator [Actinomadura violacea]MBO2458060.1 AAA family ATPase [Actinomadura violacea]